MGAGVWIEIGVHSLSKPSASSASSSADAGGRWLEDVDWRMLAEGCWLEDIGQRILARGYWLEDIGWRMLAGGGFLKEDVRRRMVAVGKRGEARITYRTMYSLFAYLKRNFLDFG